MKARELIEALQKLIAEHPKAAEVEVIIENGCATTTSIGSLEWVSAYRDHPAHVLLWER